MNNSNRLGCLTQTGALAALIAVFVIAGVAFASGSNMFNPGALNDQRGESIRGVSSHAEIAECNACHVAPWGSATMADRCMDCHKNVASQMLDAAQLHGMIAQKSPDASCRDCHKEHRGAAASLTDLDERTFPHEAFGFALNKHQQTKAGAPIVCADCHENDVSTFAADSCQTCHSDLDIAFTQAHTRAYGSDCLACHDGVDRYSAFNHNAYAFKLDGGHANIDCAKCHANPRTVADLQSAPQNCYACHQQDDKHLGEYGQQCETCHVASDWKNATFDHDRFASSSSCVACHAEPQEHFGQFGTECATCHTTNAWKPATYNGIHTFPIDHGDGNGSCQTCHPNSLTTYTCYGCHEHTETKIESKHLKEGISNFQDCMECHSDGSKHKDGDHDD
ncbi:MAG: hypothetical protein LC099_00370 [Anaerolineales bacterium]|nr:hypothetical protein [Anaerolineales bacterium]